MVKYFLFSIPVLIVICGLSFYLGGANYVYAALAAYIPSAFFVLFSYASIRWAFLKKAKTFYAVIYAGMALRFVVFILILLYIHKVTQLPFVYFVVMFMAFYLLFQIQEARLVLCELKKRK